VQLQNAGTLFDANLPDIDTKINFDPNALNLFVANLKLRAREKRYTPYSILKKRD
jgi:hypothetical protein